MTSRGPIIRAVLFAAVVAIVAGSVVPSYDEVWPEPSPAKNPFYYVDYEISAVYRRRVVNRLLWPWVIGLAAGIPAGLVFCWVCRPRPLNQL